MWGYAPVIGWRIVFALAGPHRDPLANRTWFTARATYAPKLFPLALGGALVFLAVRGVVHTNLEEINRQIVAPDGEPAKAKLAMFSLVTIVAAFLGLAGTGAAGGILLWRGLNKPDVPKT